MVAQGPQSKRALGTHVWSEGSENIVSPRGPSPFLASGRDTIPSPRLLALLQIVRGGGCLSCCQHRRSLTRPSYRDRLGQVSPIGRCRNLQPSRFPTATNTCDIPATLSLRREAHP